MKPIILSLVLVASSQVQAAGFAPWNDRHLQSAPDAEQSGAVPGSFYRGTVKVTTERPDNEQNTVLIAPWYRRGQV